MSASELQRSGAWATAWRTSRAGLGQWLRARTGFWRSLLEVTLLVYGVYILSYPLIRLLSSPWFELLTYASFGFYIWVAWRLGPGQGKRWWRVLRVLAWASLFGMLCGVLNWLLLALLPFPRDFLGVAAEDMRYSFGDSLLVSVVSIVGMVLPIRAAMALWAAGQRQLRWRLTFAALLLGILTTLSIPLALGIFIGLISLSSTPPITEPGAVAQRITIALQPLIEQDAAPEQLEATLRGLLEGSVRLPVPATSHDEDIVDHVSLNSVQRLLLLDPGGRVLASAGATAPLAGTLLPAAEMQRLALLRAQVASGGCSGGRPTDGVLIDTALCGLFTADGRLAAVLVVENNITSAVQFGAQFGRVVTIALVSTNIALILFPITSMIIVPLALLAGYILARRLTRRIEGLAMATADVAAGNLARRVELTDSDEIGRLAADFNTMAARLEERDQALNVEKERVEHLLQANRQLVANVSHELRTPLATLRGYLEVLDQEHGDKLPAHDMAVIQSEVRRLTALIDDLFTLARAEAQQLPLNIEAVDVAALTRQLADTLAPLARRERQIEVVTALPPDLPLVCADRMRLEQVLLNLAQNALRHTPPGGIVAFEGQASAETVIITVADTGVGIAPEELALVFERFYRGDSSRARETGGAGLGLALVRELVTAMGGQVSAESVPSRGSRFSVTLRRIGE